jgi:hypothetical protein
MSDKYRYRDIYVHDRGLGYLALDLLALMGYVQATATLGLALCYLVSTLGLNTACGLSLLAAFSAGVEFPAIYVLRLAVRSIFVMRDRAAHETIDQDDRYKTSAGST